MSVLILGPGPYSVSHRLAVSVIFKTAPPEAAETTIKSLIDFPGARSYLEIGESQLQSEKQCWQSQHELLA